MSEMQTVGRHKYLVTGDLFFLIQDGDWDMVAAQATHQVMENQLKECGRLFVLVDNTHGGSMPPDVRRWTAEWNQRNKVSGVAIFGSSAVLRALASLALSAISLFRKTPVPTVFTKTEADARAWIDERRRQILLQAESHKPTN